MSHLADSADLSEIAISESAHRSLQVFLFSDRLFFEISLILLSAFLFCRGSYGLYLSPPQIDGAD